MLDNYRRSIFQTNEGLPQGSVITLALFNINIIVMFSKTGKEHFKFVDDSTTWSTAPKQRCSERGMPKGNAGYSVVPHTPSKLITKL